MASQQTAIQTGQATTHASSWRKTDTMWMLGLYGTAIGAGVLFCRSMPASADWCR